MKDAALVVVENHEHWLVTTRGLKFGTVACGGEDGHVLGGAAEVGIAFINGMLPDGGHVFRDGMFGVAGHDFKRVGLGVFAGFTGAGVADDDTLGVEIDIGSRFLCPITPTAEADHEVILSPQREAVIGGMNADEASATGNEFLESGAGRRGPVGGVPAEIADNEVILSKVGRKIGIGFRLFPSLGFANASEGEEFGLVLAPPYETGAGNVNGFKEAGVFKILAHHNRGFWPDLVIVLAIDDEGFELVGSGRVYRGNHRDSTDEDELLYDTGTSRSPKGMPREEGMKYSHFFNLGTDLKACHEEFGIASS